MHLMKQPGRPAGLLLPVMMRLRVMEAMVVIRDLRRREQMAPGLSRMESSSSSSEEVTTTKTWSEMNCFSGC
jgi:hypothetical protein